MLSRILSPVFVAALFCVTPLRVQAQTPMSTPASLQMALASPFSFTPKPLQIMARNGKWVPVAVTLTNTGEPVSGQVELRLAPSSGSSFDYPPNTVTANVDLPTDSSKRIWLYAKLDRPGVDGLSVSFSGRGFPRLFERVPIKQAEALQQEVVVISDSDSGLSDTLRSLRTQGLYRGGKSPSDNFSSGLAPVLPFSFAKELVPDRWIGFQSADMVVLGDFPHIGLSPTQIEAIRGYVQGGGTLVVMGGANAGRLNSSPLKDLWPLKPTTSVSASSIEVTNIVSRYVPQPKNGGDRLGGAPVVVTRGALTSDAVCLEGSAKQPLFAEREEGAGRVLFLSYDPSQPPFKGWSGQGNLWAGLIKEMAQVNEVETVDPDFLSYAGNFGVGATAPSYYGSDQSTPTEELLGALSHAEQLTMPPVSRIAWFLALYVFFLVPVNYAVLRIIDKRELAWVTIPIIVVAFSVWAYSEALAIRGRAILTRQIDIVQSSIGSTKGRVDTLFWLFSPRRTTYNISSQGEVAALSDYANQAGGEQGSFTLLQPSDGSSFKIEGVPLRMWVDREFASQSLGDLKQGISLLGNKIKNNTGIDLYSAVWVQDGRFTEVGELKNGFSATVTRGIGEKYASGIAGKLGRTSNFENVFDRSTVANGIPEKALTAALGNQFGKLNGSPALLAWGKKSVARLSIGSDSDQGRQIVLFVFRLPASRLPIQLASREATVRRVSFEPFTPNLSLVEGGFAYFDACMPSTALSKIVVRAHGTGISGSKYTLSSGTTGISHTLPNVSSPEDTLFQVLDTANSRWCEIGGTMRIDRSPAGGWNFNASVPARYVRQPDNILRIRVHLQNVGMKVSTMVVEQ